MRKVISRGDTGTGTYATAQTYDYADNVRTETLPAAGGLAAETVTTGYTPQGLPSTLTSASPYVAGTTYDAALRLTGRTFGADGAGKVTRACGWSLDTNRLASATTKVGAGAGTPVANESFGYDKEEIAREALIGGALGAIGGGIIARIGRPAASAGRSFSTGADEAVFWSGIRGGDKAASAWDAKRGGTTLESTMAARGIELPAWNPSNPAAVAAWRRASANFASGARGNVRVLQEDSVRVRSVWSEVEFPALKASPSVTSITAIDPRSGASTILWAR